MSISHDTVSVSFKNTDFYPLQSLPMELEILQDLVEHDLVALKDRSRHKNVPQNLTLAEKKALKEIKGNKDLIVRKADKLGAIVCPMGVYTKS